MMGQAAMQRSKMCLLQLRCPGQAGESRGCWHGCTSPAWHQPHAPAVQMGWDGTAWHGVATSPPRAALLPGHRAVGRGLGQPSVPRALSLPSCARQLALWEEQPQEPEAPSWRGQLRLTFLVCLWSLTPELQFGWMSLPV